ncbi:MAG: GTPase ObgE, partial [Symbiobacteriaceae bacterium]|nr:GTPase ObgE [Symbiobacteriaceae bacterium]
MFLDRAQITVKSGAGGNGCVAFRREKYVPQGGPSGGDGGRGASVIAVADHNRNTLLDFRYKRHYTGDPGSPGTNKNRSGAQGSDLYIPVPLGTAIFDDTTGELVADLVNEGDQAILAPGGRGGRGNARFATATNRSPELAEKGVPGVERAIRLELRLIADVGLVGLPNAGKSTLLSVISAATPKIASYPFTTLEPQLGVVALDDSSFVVADIPGLVEGASRGIGLGFDFLRHIERTRLLVHLLDTAATDGRTPQEDFLTLNQELALYNPELATRPQLVALNKIDLPQSNIYLTELQRWLNSQGYQVFPISAMTREGLTPLLQAMAAQLSTLPLPNPLSFYPQPVSTTPASTTTEDPVIITREDDASWRVSTQRLLRLVALTDFDNTASL